MRLSRSLIAMLAAGLVAAGCSAESEPSPDPGAATPSSAVPYESASATPEPQVERVSLSLAPGISQPGVRPAASPDHVASVEVRPAVAEVEVGLQVRRAGGWREVETTRTDGAGAASFAVAPSGAGEVIYRAEVENLDGPRVRSNAASSSWRSVFSDDFDGKQLDTSKWSYRQLGLYNPEGSRACSVSDRSAVEVGGGTLQLQVRADRSRAGERCATADYGTHDYYLNGHVSTEDKYSFTFGLAAARVKFQQGRGQHGAFWLQAADPQYVPGRPDINGAEIDVAEFFGEGYAQGGMASFLYYLNSADENEKVGGLVPNATKHLPDGDTWWDKYHVFSVEWTPGRYVFRVDGREVYTTIEGVSGAPEFLILSLLSSDWELKKLDPSTLPSTMKVDWARVWHR